MEKLAVTYENGQIFQHFGRTESFKVYEIEDGKIISSEVISSEGAGHGALAGQLFEMGINTVICGGLGMGMLNGLQSAGIKVCAGVSGDADAAVQAYVDGTLEYNEDAHNCHGHGDHHQEEGGCGCHGGHQGGCGCHHEPVGNEGKKVKVHYTGTFNDGTKFDSSYDRGETLDFICGAGQMIRGFDEAVKMMSAGEVVDVHLMPSEAYGESDPNAILTCAIAELPGSEDLVVGQTVYMENQFGRPFPVKVTAKDDVNITLDANHEMAGKELNFKIELVAVED